MEDKDKMWDTIFEKLISGEFDHAQEIFMKAGITIEINEIAEKFGEVFSKKMKEVTNELSKYSEIQLMGFIFMMIIINWNNSILNSYKIDALQKGPLGSKEYIKALSESIDSEYEKDFDLIFRFIKVLDKVIEKKD